MSTHTQREDAAQNGRSLVPYRMCSYCIMDTTDPDITFDDSGICNHCATYRALVAQHIHPCAEAKVPLSEMVANIKAAGRRQRYDCVIGVSGGVDSTYVAWKVKELGLRPLAVHLDNGWNSEIAVRNIHNVLTTLGIDLHTVVLDWEEFRDIQRAFLRASTPDAEIPSDHAIFATMHNVAKQRGISHVISGLNIKTETHMPSAWSQGHYDWGYIKAVHRRFGTLRAIRSFPHFTFYQCMTRFRHGPPTFDILNYIDYSKTEALKLLPEVLGWKDYGGKHHESIYTRWFQGCYLPRKFGFDKRRSHLSSRICSGELTRDEGLTEIAHPAYPQYMQEQDSEYVAKKLGLSAREFDEIMVAVPKRFEDYPSYAKLGRSKWFQGALKVYRFVKCTWLRPQA